MRQLFLSLVVVVIIGGISAAQEFPTIDHIPSQSLIENLGTGLQAAEGIQTRPVPTIALDLIKNFEGWVPDAYNDPSGYCTIGYGHLIALKRCETIDLGEFRGRSLTLMEGEKLLEQDTRFARRAVARLVAVNLDDNQFGALSSFVFNIGETNFTNSTMLLLLNDGQSDQAAKQFGRWIKSKGVVLEGLRQRRACERSLFEGQLKHDANGRLQRSNCESFGITDTSGGIVDIMQGE